MREFANASLLKKMGVLGMNRRNFNLIAKNNPRRLYPIVDHKLKTKKLCKANNIPTPKLLGVCECQHHVKELKVFLEQYNRFVFKPAKGSGGKGILVIVKKEGDQFFKPSGVAVSLKYIENHVSNMLSGLYSLGGNPDIALIEDVVQFSDTFDGYSYEGVPDVRIIVYKGFPIMAMTRLSTEESDGKANLHQGAVGVGINLGTGKALHAVQHARAISHHPDTGKDLSTLIVPHWKTVLELASRSYSVTRLGYIGADIVLDKYLGPLLLELNARPGLAIQVANGRGLLPLIEKVDHIQPNSLNYQQRAELSMNMFKDTREMIF